MRILIPNLEIAAASARLPRTGEHVTVSVSPNRLHLGGADLDLPAFGRDPRLCPGVPMALRNKVDRFTALAYAAVAEMLSRPDVTVVPERTGIFVANTNAGWSYGEPELAKLVAYGVERMYAYQATAWFPAAAQGEVSIGLGLRGNAKTTAGRFSGFGEALWLARDSLERGVLDLAVVGAAESLVSWFALENWSQSDVAIRTGPAEGAIFFALRRPNSPSSGPTLADLRYDANTREHADSSWIPTLSSASRLYDVFTAHQAAHLNGTEPIHSEVTTVELGGGYLAELQPRQLIA